MNGPPQGKSRLTASPSGATRTARNTALANGDRGKANGGMRRATSRPRPGPWTQRCVLYRPFLAGNSLNLKILVIGMAWLPHLPLFLQFSHQPFDIEIECAALVARSD